jgi:hypothetical protein
VRSFSEIWVIDHSTSTEEAAGHTSGNSGKGGDILYRWGNPQAYDQGTADDKKYFSQHDARWINPGCPGEGNILVFNNGNWRPGNDYTSIDEIVSPVDENGFYEYTPGNAYGPEEQIWIYDTDFFSIYVGGVQRLPSGNTLICSGPGGEFLEVTPDKVIVWEYENPYPNPLNNNVFKFEYYPPEDPPPPNEPDLDCTGILEWINVKDGEILEGNFHVKNIGDADSLLNWSIASFPNWGDWSFNPESGVNLTPESGPLNVQVTVVAPYEGNKLFEGYIKVENQQNPEDKDVIPIYLKTPRVRSSNIPFLELLINHPNLFPILQLLLHRLGL